MYANANPVVYEDPTGNSGQFVDCIAGIYNKVSSAVREIFASFLRLRTIDKVNLIVNSVNMAISLIEMFTADTIWDLIGSWGSFSLSLISICLISCNPLSSSVIILTGIFGISDDLYEISQCIYKRQWGKLVYNLILLGFDIAFLFFDIRDIKIDMDFEKILNSYQFSRTPDQTALVDLTMEAMANGGVTEEIKDILFSWCEDISSLEDVWNILYHLFK